MSTFNVDALEAAQVAVTTVEESKPLADVNELLLTDDPNLDPETVVVDATEKEEWRPTHYIGPYTVMQRTFAGGLPYWVEEDGKRRRPTEARELRPYHPKPEPARQMYLDLEAFALVCAAVIEEDGRVERGWNIAEITDVPDSKERHVRLSRMNPETREYERFMIQVPHEIEVAGARLP